MSPSPIFHPFRVIEFRIHSPKILTHRALHAITVKGDDDRSIQDGFLMTDPAVYRIRVLGRLNPNWSERLRGMALLTVEEWNEIITEIRGQLPDQAALMGVLDELYNSAIPLLSLECMSIDPYKG